jgi:hypothetical protein
LLNTYPAKQINYAVSDVENSLLEEPAIGLLNFEWSVGKDYFINAADIVIQRHDKQGRAAWVTNLDQNKIRIHIKRYVKDGANYIMFDCVYHDADLSFKWSRNFYIAAKGGEIRVADTFVLPIDCTIGIRFCMNSYVSMTPDGEQTLISMPVASGTPKRNLPINTSIFQKYDARESEKPGLDFVGANAKHARKSAPDAQWIFRSSGGDETLRSDPSENVRTILLMKSYAAQSAVTLKWSFCPVVFQNDSE